MIDPLKPYKNYDHQLKKKLIKNFKKIKIIRLMGTWDGGIWKSRNFKIF